MRYRNCKNGLIPLVILVWGGVSPVVVTAESALDEVTMRVIGLDELPAASVPVIEIPQPDLGEFADINESFISPAQQDVSNTPSPSLDAITDAPGTTSGVSPSQ